MNVAKKKLFRSIKKKIFKKVAVSKRTFSLYEKKNNSYTNISGKDTDEKKRNVGKVYSQTLSPFHIIYIRIQMHITRRKTVRKFHYTSNFYAP